MELRHLEVFLSIAEHRHFGRAAAELHTAQSALSAQLARFERQLGVRLFERDARHVELTAAGHALLEPARATLAAAAHAGAAVRAHRLGDSGVLRIGICANGAAEVTTPILRAFEAERPFAEVRLRELGFLDQTAACLRGEVDVALVRPPYDEPGLHLEPLLVEPRVAVVAEDHRLAGAGSVALADLLDEPFVCAHPDAPAAWRRHWLLVDHRGGREPAVVFPDPATTTEWLATIASGRGIGTTSLSIGRSFPFSGVVFVPIRDDAEGSEIAVAMRRDDASPLVRAFVAVAVKTAAVEIARVPQAWLPVPAR